MVLHIGFGLQDVTPPLGVAMDGYAKREGVARAVHDPLQARALVAEDGSTAVAVVVADVIELSRRQVERTGLLVERWTGIPRGHVIAAGTHTHSGPVPWAKPPAGARPAPNHHYGQLLPDLLASAVCRAWAERRPASLAAATACTRAQTVNRRCPGAATDEELCLIHVRRRGGADALVLSYACHGVVMGPDNLSLSADWIGGTRAALERDHPGLFPVVLAAPSGDVNPLPGTVRRLLAEHGPEFFTNDPFSGIYDRTGGTFAEIEAM
ncbi:MAG: neutral/alkaline non-lysosomal ceramidase N-terminal domain-containing protein, partial [Candidatus Latescibacterota bacterium]